MFDLENENISFIIINSFKPENTVLENYHSLERLYSVLDSKEYSIFSLKDYNKSKAHSAYLGIIPIEQNDTIREDALHILEFLNIQSAILKYRNDKSSVLLERNGTETPLLFNKYPDDSAEQFYVFEGLSFNFKKDKRYFYPKSKNHLKNGMIVEYSSDKVWKSKEIINLDNEYDKMYSLLIKYDKLRIPIN